ncbi:DUF2993 domain-containing protein [Mycobacterium sp. URHB0044]|uniref:DUF2993 domain-containing protein n=1 Tax=Mycobacterium sp. URHB0044 TaxID=1380386 RepID=UPI0004905666|nr:DUF2993 domain-containing protein [Mycobacterium sp. URHB0044]
MTRPGPPRRWDPFRPLDMLAALWSTAAVAPVNTGAAAAYRTLFLTLRRLVVGRRLTVRLADGDLALTITEFDSRLDLRGLSVGQLNDVRLAARDLYWNGHRFERARAVLHNVHMRPSVPPVLVAAPVELTLELPAPVLDELFRWAAPRLSGEVGPDGVARLSLARRQGSGHVEVETRIEGSTLWITPRAIVRRRRWPLPQRTPGYPVRLPELPRGLRLTDVELAPGVVRLTGTLPQWRMEMPRARLEDVIGQLSTVGRPLNLIWPGRDI